MNWKRFMLSSTLLVTLACGDSEGDGPLGDGGGDVTGEDGGVDRIDGGDLIDAGPGRGDGGGFPRGDGGGSGGGSADCNDRTLKIKIRDFKEAHPDFEDFTGSAATTGLVQSTLVNSKPVFNASKGQISSAASFAQWYQDDPSVNKTIEVERTLTSITGGYEFWDPQFFPIDGMGWGNEGNVDENGDSHNFHFTTEIHTRFTYQRGQVFKFTGDDDLWIFVNDKLALDLGGLHSELSGTIDFDAQAESLGIVPGQTYQMDIFHAERHTVHSRFRITTNIECFEDVVVI